MRRINVEALCHAEARSDSVRVGGEAKIALIRQWLERQLAHEEVRRFALEALPSMTPKARATALAKLANEAHVEHCPLTDLWAWEAEPLTTRAPCEEACELRQRASSMEARAECELGCRDF